jgi:GT2 family glycosyltransferase
VCSSDLQNAKGNILFFLDNDAVLDYQGLKIAVEKFRKNPEVGIIGCQMLNYASKEPDRNLWIYPVSLTEYVNREFDFYTYCGGGCAIRREVFAKVGLFWNDLFFGREEVDYGIRAMDRGYRILYSPEIKVLHRDSCERKISPVERDCYLFRNTLWVGWRLFPAIASLRLTFVTIITYLIRSVRYKYSGRMLAVVIKSFKKINLLWDNSCRIKSGTYKKYRQLSREGGFLARAKIILFAK